MGVDVEVMVKVDEPSYAPDLFVRQFLSGAAWGGSVAGRRAVCRVMPRTLCESGRPGRLKCRAVSLAPAPGYPLPVRRDRRHLTHRPGWTGGVVALALRGGVAILRGDGFDGQETGSRGEQAQLRQVLG